MQVLIFDDYAWKRLFIPPKIGVLGSFSFDPLNGELSHRDSQKALPCAETRHITYRWSKSVHRCWLSRIQRIKLKKEKGILRNQNVTSHMFIETTHVVAAPCGFAWVVIPRRSYIFHVSSNSVQVFLSLGGRGSKFTHSHYFGYWLLQQLALLCKLSPHRWTIFHDDMSCDLFLCREVPFGVAMRLFCLLGVKSLQNYFP